jgi:hypothetical protein
MDFLRLASLPEGTRRFATGDPKNRSLARSRRKGSQSLTKANHMTVIPRDISALVMESIWQLAQVKDRMEVNCLKEGME